MPEVILPCPACGGTDLGCWEFVVCKDCEMRGPRDADESAAIAAWNAIPRTLTWTTEPPKVAGWYFQRTAGEDQTINVAYVYSGLAGLYCKCGCRNTPLKCWIGFEWAGPIAPPVEG